MLQKYFIYQRVFSRADNEDDILTDFVAPANLMPARDQGSLRNNRGENI